MIGSETYIGWFIPSFIQLLITECLLCGKHLYPWLIRSFAFLGVDVSRLLPFLGGCGVSAYGLGRLFKSSKQFRFCLMRQPPIQLHPSMTAALGLCGSELSLRGLLGWPIHSPSGKGISPISAHSSTTFTSALVPMFPFIWVCPTASHSHLQISSRWRRIRHYWPESISLHSSHRFWEREEGKSLGVHKPSAFPLLLLPAFSADEFLGKTLCVLFLEWTLSLLKGFLE